MFSCYRGNNKNKSTIEEDGLFMKNGGAVLEQTILLLNGKSNSLRSYSSHELNMATHNFNPSQIIHASLNYTLYKGSVIVNDDDDEEEISVKMFFPKFNNERHLKMIANEVAVASQMSKHRNVLKLLGYCLDSDLFMAISSIFVQRKTWGQILWDINSTKSQMNDGSSNYDWNGKLKHELETNALVEEEEEEDEEIRGQIMEYAKLVERCTNESVEERPNMVDVAKDHILIKTNNTL
ncbi:hypothetical protein F8388_024298 [Cannabis sativa]|uniref:Serine-threonine/tyrosine-protein kinase catalytic domain-containing protein n=1 Tax=Cannabis sativa TaxID=3483 RepID=A0A7J6GXH9_CANSA|nr:hypothetical protein F8388_024298 [Cannabis sativa]KAF4387674.1 hypothetical protein G4B88_004001 [Cannabis sativa]